MSRDVCEHFNPADLPCAKCEEKRKSEALFLADELEIPLGTVIQSEVNRRAAAELRRLYAQRDALLEALKLMLEQFTKTPSTLKDSEARIKAHAAIAKAEENI